MARRFRFPLATLLRVRRLHEREAKRKVGAKRAEIARLDRLDQQTRLEISARQQTLLGTQRQERVDPLDLTRGWAWIAHLRRLMSQRQVQRMQYVAELQRLQAEFLEARKQARVIEKLRERRWAEYVHDRARHEQAAADEMAQQLHIRAQTMPEPPARSPAGAVSA